MDIKESYSFWELTGIVAGGIVALLFSLWRMAKWVFGEYKKVVTERDAARQANIEKTYTEIGNKLDKTTRAVEEQSKSVNALAQSIESQERNFNKRFEQMHEEIKGIDIRVKNLEQKE